MELKNYDPLEFKKIRFSAEGDYFVFATCDEDGPMYLVFVEETEPVIKAA